MHKQEFAEIVFVLKGTGEYGTGSGLDYTITPGEILIVPPNGKHAYYSVDGLEIFYIIFDPQNLPLPLLNLYDLHQYRNLFGRNAEYYHKVREDYPRVKPSQEVFEELVDLMEKFLHIQKLNSIGCDCEKMGLFMCIIGRLCDIWHETDTQERSQLTMTMHQISQYIAENFNREIVLQDLAKKCSMSVSSLLRHFHKAFGTTPKDYLKKLRLDRAATLLQSTALRVSEVADQCGFSTSSYFIAVFKEYFGKTPEEYRRTER